MAAKWQAFNGPKQLGMPGNDDSHNFTDPNKGGGPAAPVVRNAKKIPPASRGGAYMSGLRMYANTSIRGTRGSKGNPASRGSPNGEARGRGAGVASETRVPMHGGSPQHRERESSNFPMRGGMAAQGQGRDNKRGQAPGELPNYGPTNPRPTAGNVRGRMQKRIAGRFKQDTKGPRTNGVIGSYGRGAITSNT